MTHTHIYIFLSVAVFGTFLADSRRMLYSGTLIDQLVDVLAHRTLVSCELHSLRKEKGLINLLGGFWERVHVTTVRTN